jgi:Zn-dependent peptidase ImmA (M78 family)/DNA-binding XRE family transcriptional regulator
MAKRVEALVEPELLVWARRKAGYTTVEEAADKANVSIVNLEAWENGLARPSIPQLRKLAKTYRRRIAVFYLPEPPRDFPPIKDYRVVWGAEQEPLSPALLAEIEQAHVRREIAIDLLTETGETPPRLRFNARVEDDPEQVAARLRRAIGIGADEQAAWDDDRAGFNAWRFAIERIGALVLQMTTVDRDEARGFSIADWPLPVIVANNSDPYVARSFTLIHEFTHAALHESGICDLSDTARTERFCNHVAGAVLVPASALLGEQVVREHGGDSEWSDAELKRLAATYRVSREAVLRRLLLLGRTDEQFYAKKRREFQAEREERAAKQTPGEPTWGPSPSTVAIVRAGHYFARLVLTSHSRGSITASDVADHLGVRMKHVPSIERSVFPARG